MATKASLWLGRQVGTDEFLVVAGVDALVGEGRVGPADAVTLAELLFGGFEQLDPADQRASAASNRASQTGDHIAIADLLRQRGVKE